MKNDDFINMRKNELINKIIEESNGLTFESFLSIYPGDAVFSLFTELIRGQIIKETDESGCYRLVCDRTVLEKFADKFLPKEKIKCGTELDSGVSLLVRLENPAHAGLDIEVCSFETLKQIVENALASGRKTELRKLVLNARNRRDIEDISDIDFDRSTFVLANAEEEVKVSCDVALNEIPEIKRLYVKDVKPIFFVALIYRSLCF